MPDAQTNAPESPATEREWLSVAAAAGVLGLSERTVQRRAKRGDLEAREVSDEQGKRLLIRLDLPTGADKLPTPSHVPFPEAADTLAPPADKLPTGADTSLSAHLLEENRFLRGVIEQLQRDAIELRAIARDALKIAPRQLTAGDSSASGADAPNNPQSVTSSATVEPDTTPGTDAMSEAELLALCQRIGTKRPQARKRKIVLTNNHDAS